MACKELMVETSACKVTVPASLTAIIAYCIPMLLLLSLMLRSDKTHECFLPLRVLHHAGLVQDSVNRCDADLRRDLYNGVLLAGRTCSLAYALDKHEMLNLYCC